MARSERRRFFGKPRAERFRHQAVVAGAVPPSVLPVSQPVRFSSCRQDIPLQPACGVTRPERRSLLVCRTRPPSPNSRRCRVRRRGTVSLSENSGMQVAHPAWRRSRCRWCRACGVRQPRLCLLPVCRRRLPMPNSLRCRARRRGIVSLSANLRMQARQPVWRRSRCRWRRGCGVRRGRLCSLLVCRPRFPMPNSRQCRVCRRGIVSLSENSRAQARR